MTQNPKPMLSPCQLAVVLVEPRIPQNAGNIARLCACTGVELHFVGSLGFTLDEKYWKRSGMDYLEHIEVNHWPDLPTLFASKPDWQHVVLLSSKAKHSHWQVNYLPKTFLVFGSESHGLPESLLEAHPEQTARIPMVEGLRSLNLSTSVGIVVYEALRQLA